MYRQHAYSSASPNSTSCSPPATYRSRYTGMPAPAAVPPVPAAPSAMDEDGVPYADSAGSPRPKKKKGKKGNVKSPGSGPRSRPPPAVVDVSRAAGQGRWDTLLQGEFFRASLSVVAV